VLGASRATDNPTCSRERSWLRQWPCQRSRPRTPLHPLPSPALAPRATCRCAPRRRGASASLVLSLCNAPPRPPLPAPTPTARRALPSSVACTCARPLLRRPRGGARGGTPRAARRSRPTDESGVTATSPPFVTSACRRHQDDGNGARVRRNEADGGGMRNAQAAKRCGDPGGVGG